MPDNKLTDVTDNNVGKMNDNEIINNIVWCMNPNNACVDCPYYELRASLNCVSSLFGDTIDLINRLQAENEQYAKEQHDLMIEKDELFDVAEKQKAENERLFLENQKLLSVMLRGNKKDKKNLLKQIKAEAYKEFAEKIKDNTREFGSANGVQRES